MSQKISIDINSIIIVPTYYACLIVNYFTGMIMVHSSREPYKVGRIISFYRRISLRHRKLSSESVVLERMQEVEWESSTVLRNDQS